jgi:hypothetical protein
MDDPTNNVAADSNDMATNGDGFEWHFLKP